MYHNFFIQSSVDGHLGYFHVLAIVNSAAINNGIHVSFSILLSSGYMPRSGTGGSNGSSIFNFLKETSILFSIWLYQFTFPPTVQEGSLFCAPSPVFIVCRFLVMAILTGVRWYFIVVLIWFSLIISDDQHIYLTYSTVRVSLTHLLE